LRVETIARNYAAALFELGEKSGRTEEYARWIDALAGAIEVAPQVQGVLLAPKVPKAEKARLLTEAVAQAPNEFKLFLQAVVKRGRQGLLAEINRAYLRLLDVKFNRIRAGVTLARKPDPALQAEIVDALARRLGKEVIATFTEDPAILGGVVVRLGDRVLDGSVKRRMTRLRRQLLR
jgi:F-type H+-transporting ATPase subunit delta